MCLSMNFCIKCLGHFEGTAINLGLAVLTKLFVCVCVPFSMFPVLPLSGTSVNKVRFVG